MVINTKEKEGRVGGKAEYSKAILVTREVKISIQLLDYIAVHAMTPYSHVVQKSCILDRYYVTVMHTKVR